jgi:hypothetical protein
LQGHPGDVPYTGIVITGFFALGGVGLGSALDLMRSRRAERQQRIDVHKREVIEVVTAAGHLLDAVRLFRSVTTFRRGLPAGFSTGLDFGTQYLPDKGSVEVPEPWRLFAALIASVRDIFKLGGLADQMQISSGERYQQIVTPPLERLTAAIAAVQLGEPGRLTTAAERLAIASGDLTARAQSGKKKFEHAEKAFKNAQQDFSAASLDTRPRLKHKSATGHRRQVNK